MPFWLKGPSSRVFPGVWRTRQLFSNTPGGNFIKKKRGGRKSATPNRPGMDENGLSRLPRALGGSDSFSKRAQPPESGSTHRTGREGSRKRSRHRDRRRRRHRSADDEATRPAASRRRRAVEGHGERGEEGSWERVSDPEFQLGTTSGVIAAGAWGARLEIAGLIEAGCSSEQLLSIIRRGKESGEPLRLTSPSRGAGPSEKAHSGVGSYSPRSERGLRRSRTRSVVASPSAPLEEDTPDKGVSQLLENEGEDMESVIAEQKMILSTLARREDDPPWMFPAPLSKEPLYGSGTKVASGLKMEATPMSFSKKANPPPKESAVSKPPAPARVIQAVAAEEESLPTFSRKAKPPPVGTLPEPVRAGVPPTPRPGGNTKADTLEEREHENLRKFMIDALEIFEGMEVLGIPMDVSRYVRTTKGVDKDKFLLHTAPNRASTGLRYTRVMKGIMSWVESFDPIPAGERPTPLECLRLVEYIELLMQKGVGFNTPQTLLFAVDFFSKAFGFNPAGQEWNRAKRLAMRYKKSKPGLANRAPLFGKETLRSLEEIVLNDLFQTPFRIAAGKLRLCCQASIRYDDLVHTPLSSLEWVRRKGGTTVVAVRAKSTQGKNKARPWIASLMGTRPENDRWLCVLLEMVLDIHGSSWKADDHFGKDVSRDYEGFTRKPARLESDVASVKMALRLYKKDGGEPAMTDREIDLLRWHGGKATLTSLMQHLELDPKMIRLAGDWAAKEDAMPDTYLREAQLMVLRGQESCLSYLRSGGDFCSLVSDGLVGFGPPTGDGDPGKPADASHGEASGVAEEKPVPSAEEALRRAAARLAGVRLEYQGMPGKELCAAFLDRGFDGDGRPLIEVADAETQAPVLPVEEIQKLLEPNDPSNDVYVVYSFDGAVKEVKAEPTEEGGEGQAGVADLRPIEPEPLDAVMEDDDDDREGRTLRFAMVERPTASSRLHLPATGTDGTKTSLVVPTPRCGVKGDYSFVMAGEAIDPATELCIRCFGHKAEVSCGKLCSVKTKLGEDVYRCTRRCSTDCTESGVHLCHVHGF